MGPVGEDARWEVFGPFHDYLEKAYPNVSVVHHLKQKPTELFITDTLPLS